MAWVGVLTKPNVKNFENRVAGCGGRGVHVVVVVGRGGLEEEVLFMRSIFGVLSRTKCDDPACFSIHRPRAAFQNRIAGGRHPSLAWLHLRRCITFLTVAPTPRTPHVQAPPSLLARPVARAPLPI